MRSLGSNEIEVFPTTRIEDLRFLDEYFPGLVQTEIEREADIRIFFVRGKMVGVKVNSAIQARGVVDHRFHSIFPSETTIFEIPEQVSKAVSRFMMRLDIDISALDFLLDKNEALWFLEANTMGNWVWYDSLCCSGVVALIADEVLGFDG